MLQHCLPFNSILPSYLRYYWLNWVILFLDFKETKTWLETSSQGSNRLDIVLVYLLMLTNLTLTHLPTYTYLPIYLHSYLLTYLPAYQPTYFLPCLPTHLLSSLLPTYLPYLSFNLPTFLPIYLPSIFQPTNLFAYLTAYLSPSLHTYLPGLWTLVLPTGRAPDHVNLLPDR